MERAGKLFHNIFLKELSPFIGEGELGLTITKKKDGCMYILPECIAGIKQKRLKKMPRKTRTIIKLYQNKDNNPLSYAWLSFKRL